MGLTLAECRAVTETTAVRYVLASKRGKSRILDELRATTGWDRNHARKALKLALAPRQVKSGVVGRSAVAASEYPAKATAALFGLSDGCFGLGPHDRGRSV